MPEGAARASGPWWTLLAVLALVLGGAALYARRPKASPGVRPAPVSAASEPAGGDAGTIPEPDPSVLAPPAGTPTAEPVPDLTALALAAGKRDREAAERLADRLSSRAPVGAEDLRVAEDLSARYPTAAPLLEAVLLRLAQQERARRQHAAAASLLLRALAAVPQSVPARRELLAIRFEQADWPAAEAAARDLLLAAPADPEAVRSLAYALVRQDRSREAVDLLGGYLDGHSDAAAQALLDRIRADQTAEADLGRQNLSHFHVRYDGAAHEEAGRLVLRVLERHYATLVATFSHQPSGVIPVILLSEQSYYDATGAPAWAGGHYDSFDGRVRIPIGGIADAPDLDETVLHELTHAFVADRSAALAPRELQEGLAQIVQGRRSATLLRDEGLRALADGRIGGVDGFYLAALVFVEELLAQRGQGGINDVLAAMARTRNVDEACRQVYGSDWRSLLSGWSSRFRRRYAG
jgi:hypothetical protein